MSDDIREFIRDVAGTGKNPLSIEAFALWLLDQHTVEIGVITDHGGQDEVAYCGSCGQDLDGTEACDHIIRLAALWSWHPDYPKGEWESVDEGEPYLTATEEWAAGEVAMYGDS